MKISGFPTITKANELNRDVRTRATRPTRATRATRATRPTHRR